ncbi:hypothetical protein ACHAPT_011931 [Fusarium lateritium]
MIAILLIVGVMALSPRDTIRVDDLEHYDEFMAGLSRSQFLDMYLENHKVKIDVYEHPSNHLTRSVYFKPSSTADKYFHQEKEQANRAVGETNGSGIWSPPLPTSSGNRPRYLSHLASFATTGDVNSNNYKWPVVDTSGALSSNVMKENANACAFWNGIGKGIMESRRGEVAVDVDVQEEL